MSVSEEIADDVSASVTQVNRDQVISACAVRINEIIPFNTTVSAFSFQRVQLVLVQHTDSPFSEGTRTLWAK